MHSTARGHRCMSWEASCSWSTLEVCVCRHCWHCFFLLVIKRLCLTGVDCQTQSLVEQRSSASSLASCTPLVTLSTQNERIHKVRQGGVEENKTENKS